MADNKAIHKFKSGDVFNERYTLVKLIGVGGFADVWKATDNSTGATVALKIYTKLDDDGINDLAKEYTQMQQLNHTNILKAEHFDRWGNIPYLVMKLCDGGSLDKKLGKMDEEDIFKMVSDIAAGLEYLHSNGIVHQDIKPDNILVDKKDEHPVYVLSDFGISTKTKTRLSHSVNFKNAGNSMTEAYAPPEKFSPKKSDRRPDRKGDIFSLGISIYEIATGGKPFDDLSTGRELLYGDAEVDFSEIENPRLRRIAELCMQRNKEDRPTAKEVGEMVTSDDLPDAPKTSEGGSGGNGGGGRHGVDPSRFTKRGKDRKHSSVSWPLVALIAVVALVAFFIILGLTGKSDDAIAEEPTKELKTDTIKINGITMLMSQIPEGDFKLGCTDPNDSSADDSELPAKERHVNAFSLSQTEVTQALWNALMDTNPSTVIGDNYPVNNVSWEDCQIFIQRLNAVTGETFRLPTEAEWEYAAKLTKDDSGNLSTTKYRYPGSSTADQVAWISTNSGGAIHEVAQKKPTAFGLYDMAGNVIEWCQDIYSNYATGAPVIDASQRVLRGGYYDGDVTSVRSATRGSCDKDTNMEPFGFRLAK